MEPVALKDAALWMGGRVTPDDVGDVSSVSIDSRAVLPGALFFALRGERADGHSYVASAVEAGAAAVVVERPVELALGRVILVPDSVRALGDLASRYRSRFDLPVVAITGSVGKTSTREMIAAILAPHVETLACEKNYNNEIGLPLTILRLTKRHGAAVLELAMRAAGEIDRLAEIARPSVAVITNIGHTHIEFLGSQAAIANAKSELLRRLAPGGAAVLPRHSEFFTTLRDAVPAGCRTVTYSSDPSLEADFRLLDVDYGTRSGAPAFWFRAEGSRRRIELSAPGSHHIPNALAALAASSVCGIDLDAAVGSLSQWTGTAGRMSVRAGRDAITVLDDCYNAAPESMRAALQTLARVASPRSRVVVLGEMRELGAYSDEAHRLVGAYVAETNPRLVVTVGAQATEIAAAARGRLPADARPRFVHFADTESAAAAVPGLLYHGDTVLVKGSRALAMERLVETLIAEGGSSANE